MKQTSVKEIIYPLFRQSSPSDINLLSLFLRWPVIPDSSGFNSRYRHPTSTLFSWVSEVAIMSMMDKPGELDSDLKTAWMDEAKFRWREWYHVQDDGIWDTLTEALVGKVRKSMRWIVWGIIEILVLRSGDLINSLFPMIDLRWHLSEPLDTFERSMSIRNMTWGHWQLHLKSIFQNRWSINLSKWYLHPTHVAVRDIQPLRSNFSSPICTPPWSHHNPRRRILRQVWLLSASRG